MILAPQHVVYLESLRAAEGLTAFTEQLLHGSRSPMVAGQAVMARIVEDRIGCVELGGSGGIAVGGVKVAPDQLGAVKGSHERAGISAATARATIVVPRVAASAAK